MSAIQTFHQAHKERLARIAAAAAALRQPIVVVPEPEPINQQEAEEINPRRYWFRIIGAGAPTIKDIQMVTAEFYGISENDMCSQRRDMPVVRIRQVAMFLAKTLTPKSLPEIGRRFGGRDHTTVLSAVRRIKALMETDRELADEVAEIKSQLEDI